MDLPVPDAARVVLQPANAYLFLLWVYWTSLDIALEGYYVFGVAGSSSNCS
jgi:hypothetical protein